MNYLSSFEHYALSSLGPKFLLGLLKVPFQISFKYLHVYIFSLKEKVQAGK